MFTKDDPVLAAATHTALRLAAGFLFALHGSQKLFGALGGQQIGSLASQMGVAGVLEFFGGILLIVGLFTRPAAFLLSGLMAVAYFTAHFPEGFWPLLNGGELAALYCFIWLFFFGNGAGKYSVDGWLACRRAGHERGEGSAAG